jgi:hypothetical protein
MDFEAGEGGGTTGAAIAKGFEFVQRLEELSIEVRFVAKDRREYDFFRHDGPGALFGAGARRSVALVDAGEVLVAVDHGVALGARDAAQAPGQLGDAYGEGVFERGFGRTRRNDGFGVGLPVVLRLGGDDDGLSAEAVAGGVSGDDGFPLGRGGASRHGGYLRMEVAASARERQAADVTGGVSTTCR